MGKSGILIALICCCSVTLLAQQEYDYRQVDSITYNAYLTGDWNKLIRTGKQAFKNEIDYYYLRQRMGIAFYSKGNYRSASRQFEAAANYNPESAVTRNYLYYSLLLSGQTHKANFAAASLSEKMREKSDIPAQGFFRSLYFETGPEFSSNFDDNALAKLPHEQYLQYQDMYGNSFYTSLGFALQIAPRVSVFAAYTNIIIDKKTMMQYAWNSPDSIVQEEWGFSKYFPAKPKIETGEYEYSLHQNSAYLRWNILPGKGWSIVPAIHYIHFKTKNVVIQDNSRRVLDTAYYVSSTDSVAYFHYDRIDLQLAGTDIYDDLFVVSLGINKSISVFDLGVFGSWSNFYGGCQIQYGINLAYYPLGNLDLYGNTNIKGLTEDVDTRFVFSQMVGGKLLRFLWAEAFGAFGNLKGTNESDAFLVYNITDDIDLKAGLNLIFVLSPAVSITMRYQYLQKTGFRYTYGQGNNPGEKIQDLDYINQSIIGGLKWNF